MVKSFIFVSKYRNMNKFTFLFLLIFCVLSISVHSQNNNAGNQNNAKETIKKDDPWAEFEEEEDSVPLIEFGVNFGAYFANKFSANYYNGIPSNVNKVSFVMSNKYWYNDIKRALLASDTVMVYDDPAHGETGYPLNMHYSIAFSGGLFLRMNIDRKNGLFLQANYTRLTASDILVLHVDPINYISELPDLRNVPIVGKEGRVLIDLGYQRSFPMKSKINLFFQVAGTMCYTQMIKSFFNVEDVDYNMVNIYDENGYVPGAGSQTFNVYQNEFGFGGFLGVGAGIPLTDNFGLEPNVFMQYYPTNLAHYTDFKPSFGVMLRIMMNFSKPDEK